MIYRKYDPRVKRMIIASKNPNLFPELNIPRTTALYWIKNGQVIEYEDSSSISAQVKTLKLENYKLKAANLMLIELLKKLHGQDLSVKSKPEVRKSIVQTIESLIDIIPKKEMLQILEIPTSTYFRWKSEVMGCELLKRKCDSSKPAQLSFQEQMVLVKLATNPKLKHLK